MKSKLALLEKLYLVEDSSGVFTKVPSIDNLISLNKWDEAIELINDVSVYKIENIPRNSLDSIVYILTKENVDYNLDNNEIIISSTNKVKLKNALNQMSDKKLFAKNTKVNYEEFDEATISLNLINAFLSVEGIDTFLTDDAKPIFYKICSEIGTNEYDNPFIIYLKKYRQQLSKSNLIALNNLYADYTIDENWLNGSDSRHNILHNKTLYSQIPNSKELVDVIHKYADFKIADNTRDFHFMDVDKKVFTYSEIMSKLRRVKWDDRKKVQLKKPKSVTINNDNIKNVKISNLSGTNRKYLISLLQQENGA